jgi:hypothetical protein
MAEGYEDPMNFSRFGSKLARTVVTRLVANEPLRERPAVPIATGRIGARRADAD